MTYATMSKLSLSFGNFGVHRFIEFIVTMIARVIYHNGCNFCYNQVVHTQNNPCSRYDIVRKGYKI
jgi:hypothetical protein